MAVPATPLLVPTDPARIRRRWLAAGGAVAVGVVVMAFVAFGGSTERRPAVAAPPATAPAPASSAASPPVQTSPAAPNRSAGPGAIGALTGMRRTVDEGAAAGEVRSDVAVDFDNLISNLLDQLAGGESVDLRQRVAELRRKVGQRLREGGLSAGRAQQLEADLSAVSPPG
jgi:serine/threonine-protein kinase